MVTLPEEVYHRFQVSAHVMQQPMEELLSQSIQGNLPPSLEDLPLELQDEIGVSLQRLSSQALWEMVKAPLTSVTSRHQELLQKNQEETLTAAEMVELEQLRMQMDKRVLRRSYALALLKWRGYTLPSIR
ncbi:MAG: hypothetical protein DYG89_37485 [Caldilinea sp. CFX5]|nr:hypothetical protein [Caldilinea sp. CFX5]